MDADGADRTGIEARLPGWIPVVLVVAMSLGVLKQVYGLVLQIFPGSGPGNGGVTYISLSLRLAQWSIWPDYTDVGPMVLVPAAALLWFTVSRLAWTPIPGWWTRRGAAILLGTCSALALARGLGVLVWSTVASEIERANVGLTSENGAAFLFNSGLFGQLWFAAVGGVLTWCFVVARPTVSELVEPAPEPEPPPAPSPEMFRRPIDGHSA